MPKGSTNRRRVGSRRVASFVRLSLTSASAVLLVQCADNEKGLGAECVKDQDCASGICSGQVCVAAPLTFDSEPMPSDAAAETGSADARPVDAADDATRPSDSPADSPKGAPDVAKEDAPADASPADGHGEDGKTGGDS
jgi:hypothetical protein